jgi:hypothetical protein
VRLPTVKQMERLALLGDPHMVVLSPRRKEWQALRSHGWIADAFPGPDRGRAFGGAYVGNYFLAPQRITPDGLRALADAIEKHGLPVRRTQLPIALDPEIVERAS